MATLNLKNIQKIYPHSNDQKKAKKKKGEPEKKTNLQVTEQGVIAVQSFNLDIADKEFIVLVGPSGCGKSTNPAHGGRPGGNLRRRAVHRRQAC